MENSVQRKEEEKKTTDREFTPASLSSLTKMNRRYALLVALRIQLTEADKVGFMSRQSDCDCIDGQIWILPAGPTIFRGYLLTTHQRISGQS